MDMDVGVDDFFEWRGIFTFAVHFLKPSSKAYYEAFEAREDQDDMSLYVPRFFGRHNPNYLRSWVWRHEELVNEQNKFGGVLLCAVAEEHDLEFVKELVEELHADVHVTCVDGTSVLHHTWSVETMEYLLAKGADPVKVDRRQQTPLMVHADSFNTKCMERLLRIPQVRETIDAKTIGQKYAGWTAIHFAMRGEVEDEEEQRDRDRVIELLLAAGADPRVCDAEGCTVYNVMKADMYENRALLKKKKRKAKQRKEAKQKQGQAEADNEDEDDDDENETVPVLSLKRFVMIRNALHEPDRTSLLFKSRHICDLRHGMNKLKAAEGAKTEGGGEEPVKVDNVLAKAIAYLQESGKTKEELPKVELGYFPSESDEEEEEGGKREDEEEIKKRENVLAVLAFVLGIEEEEDKQAGEKKKEAGEEAAGMPSEVFIDFLDMIAQPWDPLRER